MSAFPILLTKDAYDPVSGKMIYQFPSTQTFSNKEVALINSSFYNSFFNITSTAQNNRITIEFPTGNFSGSGNPTYLTRTLVLPDGYYSIETLNQALQNWFVNERWFYYDSGSGMNVYFVQLVANATLYSCQLNTFLVPTSAQALINGWIAPNGGTGWTVNTGTTFVAPRVVISAGLGLLLGFPPQTTPTFTSASWTGSPQVLLGTAAPEINMVSGLIMRTNLISQSTGYPVDMLALVPITSQFGAVTQFVAPHPVFSPIPNGRYNTIEIYFMDQSLRTVKLYDPDITITLEIRERMQVSA
jgi:hypothetical protein